MGLGPRWDLLERAPRPCPALYAGARAAIRSGRKKLVNLKGTVGLHFAHYNTLAGFVRPENYGRDGLRELAITYGNYGN